MYTCKTQTAEQQEHTGKSIHNVYCSIRFTYARVVAFELVFDALATIKTKAHTKKTNSNISSCLTLFLYALAIVIYLFSCILEVFHNVSKSKEILLASHMHTHITSTVYSMHTLTFTQVHRRCCSSLIYPVYFVLLHSLFFFFHFTAVAIYSLDSIG